MINNKMVFSFVLVVIAGFVFFFIRTTLVFKKEKNKTAEIIEQKKVGAEEKIALNNTKGLVDAIGAAYTTSFNSVSALQLDTVYDIKMISVSGRPAESGHFSIHEDGTITLTDIIWGTYICNGTNIQYKCIKRKV